MQPKYSAVISIQDLKCFANVQCSREGSALCLHRVRHMEMFQVTAASQGTNTGVEKHHTWFHRGENSDLLRLFQRHHRGTCLEQARSSLHRPMLAFLRTHPKMLSWTKSTTVAANLSFTLAPVAGWVSLAALGPAEPQRLLIPPSHLPAGLAAHTSQGWPAGRQIPAFSDGKGLPGRAGLVTKQSSAQCLLVNSLISPFSCRSEGMGLYHTKDTGARAASPKTNSFHKEMKESKSKGGIIKIIFKQLINSK